MLDEEALLPKKKDALKEVPGQIKADPLDLGLAAFKVIGGPKVELAAWALSAGRTKLAEALLPALLVCSVPVAVPDKDAFLKEAKKKFSDKGEAMDLARKKVDDFKNFTGADEARLKAYWLFPAANGRGVLALDRENYLLALRSYLDDDDRKLLTAAEKTAGAAKPLSADEQLLLQARIVQSLKRRALGSVDNLSADDQKLFFKGMEDLSDKKTWGPKVEAGAIRAELDRILFQDVLMPKARTAGLTGEDVLEFLRTHKTETNEVFYKENGEIVVKSDADAQKRAKEGRAMTWEDAMNYCVLTRTEAWGKSQKEQLALRTETLTGLARATRKDDPRHEKLGPQGVTIPKGDDDGLLWYLKMGALIGGALYVGSKVWNFKRGMPIFGTELKLIKGIPGLFDFSAETRAAKQMNKVIENFLTVARGDSLADKLDGKVPDGAADAAAAKRKGWGEVGTEFRKWVERCKDAKTLTDPLAITKLEQFCDRCDRIGAPGSTEAIPDKSPLEALRQDHIPKRAGSARTAAILLALFGGEAALDNPAARGADLPNRPSMSAPFDPSARLEASLKEPARIAPTTDTVLKSDSSAKNDGSFERTEAKAGQALAADLAKQKEISKENIDKIRADGERLAKSSDAGEREIGEGLKRTAEALEGKRGPTEKAEATKGILEEAGRLGEGKGRFGGAGGVVLGLAIVSLAVVGWIYSGKTPTPPPLKRATISGGK
jgi:hypothetical protein